jgi:NADH-quinone oxidoreductase subunit D
MNKSSPDFTYFYENSGIVKFDINLENDLVSSCDFNIGYEHKGLEKIAETTSVEKFVSYLSSIDDVRGIFYSHAFVIAVERLLGIEEDIPERAKYIRMLLSELARVHCHIRYLKKICLQIDALNFSENLFEIQGKVYDFLKRITLNKKDYIKIGGVLNNIDDGIVDDIYYWVDIELKNKFNSLAKSLSSNKLIKNRTVGIGVIDYSKSLDLSLRGPNLRASGIDFDIRKKFSYELYDNIKFNIPVGKYGDAYSRMLVRLEEVKISLSIIRTISERLNRDNFENLIVDYDKEKLYNKHIYSSVEAADGEFGIHLVTGDKENEIYRLKINQPDLVSVSATENVCLKHHLEDLSIIIYSLGINGNDVDK